MNFRFLFLLLPLLGTSVWADTVTLKNGEKLPGKILRETAESVVLEYQFSPTIVDERVILRADIAKIEREQEDTQAFERIQTIPLPVTALDASVYDEVIVGKLQSFLTLYPYSAHCAAVRAKIGEFEAEKKRIANGQLKLEGGWISDFRIEEEKYQIDARRTHDAQQAQFAKGNMIGSLNQFDLIEKSWPLSAIYPDSVESARLALAKLDQVLTHELRNFPIHEEKRRVMLERTSIENKPRIEAAQKAEKENALASLAGVKKDLKYPHYSVLVKESMQNLQRIVQAERVRLEAVDLKSLKVGVAEAQQTARLLEQNELALAASSLKNAETAWPQMELLPRLKTRLNEAQQSAIASTEAQTKAVEDAADLKKQESESPQP